MKKKQFLQKYRPDIFLGMGKMCGFLFLFLLQFFSAHDGIGTEKIVFEIESTSANDSTSTDQRDLLPSQVKIYVTPGTTLVGADENNFNVVKVEAKESTTKKKFPKTVPKKVLLAKKEVKEIQKKKFINRYNFSGKIPSEIHVSEFSKTRFAVLNTSNKKIENGNALLQIFYFQKVIADFRTELFLYSESIISTYHFAVIFARPPPFFV